MAGPKIKDLHGNIFSVQDWRFYISIPIAKFNRIIFTKDHESQEVFNLAISENKYIGFFYVEHLNLYIGYKLQLEGYEESLDIRKSHLYVKKRKHN